MWNSKKDKRPMTESEVQKLVLEQTREFRCEIEKRFSNCKHKVYYFPLDEEPEDLSDDSSLQSLENTQSYDLHMQNIKTLGRRKNSISEKILRQPKSIEKHMPIDRQIETASCSTVKEKLSKFVESQFKKHQFMELKDPLSHRYVSGHFSQSTNKSVIQSRSRPLQDNLNKTYQNNINYNSTNLISNSQHNNNNTQSNHISINNNSSSNTNYQTTLNKTPECSKSTTVHNRIQKLIQENLNKSGERVKLQNTNSTLLRLLQKNGMIRSNEKINTPLRPDRCLIQKTIDSREPSILITSPSYQPQRSYFCKQSPSVLRQQKRYYDNSSYLNDRSNQSIHRLPVDSNNTSRSHLSPAFNFQQLLSNNQNQNRVSPLSIIGSRDNNYKAGIIQKSESFKTQQDKPLILRDQTNQPITPLRGNNKSFQENYQVYQNGAKLSKRVPTQPIKSYIQVDNYLKSTLPTSSIKNKIRDHVILLTNNTSKSPIYDSSPINYNKYSIGY